MGLGFRVQNTEIAVHYDLDSALLGGANQGSDNLYSIDLSVVARIRWVQHGAQHVI